MRVMKMPKPLLAVLVIAIFLLVVGFVLGDRMNDFLRDVLAAAVAVLIAVLLAWFFFEERASMLLHRVGTILERNEQYQRSVQQSWTENNLRPIAVQLLEVTHQLLHDSQGIEDNVSIGRQDISLEAQKVLREADDFSRPNKHSFIEINSAAASSLTQSSKLLDRLEAYLKAGPDWIKDDPRIAQLIQEAVTCADNLPPALFIYSNVHPMARRVRLQPGSFEKIVAEVLCTSLSRYITELANLTIALDKKAHGE